MIILAILAMLAIPIGVHIGHPEYYVAMQNGKSMISWKYVEADDCQSGLNEDGSYTITVLDKVYFKQVNKDGTVSEIFCYKK